MTNNISSIKNQFLNCISNKNDNSRYDLKNKNNFGIRNFKNSELKINNKEKNNINTKNNTHSSLFFFNTIKKNNEETVLENNSNNNNNKNKYEIKNTFNEKSSSQDRLFFSDGADYNSSDDDEDELPGASETLAVLSDSQVIDKKKNKKFSNYKSPLISNYFEKSDKKNENNQITKNFTKSGMDNSSFKDSEEEEDDLDLPEPEKIFQNSINNKKSTTNNSSIKHNSNSNSNSNSNPPSTKLFKNKNHSNENNENDKNKNNSEPKKSNSIGHKSSKEISNANSIMSYFQTGRDSDSKIKNNFKKIVIILILQKIF